MIDYLNELPAIFYGSLFGTIVSGSIAVGILMYQTRQKNKEQNFQTYGTMKVISIQLYSIQEYENFTKQIINHARDLNGDKRGYLELLNRPKALYEKLIVLMESERDNIPYSFVSRYFSVLNSLRSLVRILDITMNTADYEGQKESVLEVLHEATKVSNEFSMQGQNYLSKIEKKYKINDYY